MRAWSRHALAAVSAALLVSTAAPASSAGDCDAATTLAVVRADIADLHQKFTGNAVLTAPLDVVDDRIATVEASFTESNARKTKSQLRGVIRKLKAFRRRVHGLARRHKLDQTDADKAVTSVDASIATLEALLKGVGAPPTCPSTTTTVTVTTTTSETSTTETSVTTTTSTKTTTHVTRPTFPTITLTFVTITIPPKRDYQQPAKYGEANLSNGFSPDPYSVGTTSGGPVNVSYLGGSCSGFASVAPDLRINFGGGGASLLRIYFVGSNGDPAIVVNDPYGNFSCVDDSFGTVNPTIDFNNPAGGTYDVWVASYAGNTTISGTLSVTEDFRNHP